MFGYYLRDGIEPWCFVYLNPFVKSFEKEVSRFPEFVEIVIFEEKTTSFTFGDKFSFFDWICGWHQSSWCNFCQHFSFAISNHHNFILSKFGHRITNHVYLRWITAMRNYFTWFYVIATILDDWFEIWITSTTSFKIWTPRKAPWVFQLCAVWFLIVFNWFSRCKDRLRRLWITGANWSTKSSKEWWLFLFILYKFLRLSFPLLGFHVVL
jgi:hypothetical protein